MSDLLKIQLSKTAVCKQCQKMLEVGQEILVKRGDEEIYCTMECIIASQTVNMVVSGYEWQCPNCLAENYEIEAKTIVECGFCFREFYANEINHAYS